MRVLFVSPRSAWVRYNLLATLRAMGHEVVPWDWGSGWPQDQVDLRERRQRIGARLVDYAQRQHRRRPFDLIFCYLYATVVGPEAVRELRALGGPVVNFSCNNVPQFHLVAEIAPHFDCCIVPERAALNDYRAVGARTVHLGLAANPEYYRPYPMKPRFDVTFVGQRYADRAEHVLYLKRQGVDVRVWGAGWRRGLDLPGAIEAARSVVEDEGPGAVLHAALARIPDLLLGRLPRPSSPPNGSSADAELRPIAGHRLTHAQMVKLFSRSYVSLGFSSIGSAPGTGPSPRHTRLRDFEAPMSGAFYLTEHHEELQDYFELGREMESYQDQEDLLDKVRFYLRHPELAQAIRAAGQARARVDHTWERRYETLFRELGLKGTKG